MARNHFWGYARWNKSSFHLLAKGTNGSRWINLPGKRVAKYWCHNREVPSSAWQLAGPRWQEHPKQACKDDWNEGGGLGGEREDREARC